MKEIRFSVYTTKGNAYIVALNKTVNPNVLFVDALEGLEYKQLFWCYVRKIDLRRFRSEDSKIVLAESLLNTALVRLDMPSESIINCEFFTE